MPEIIDLSQEIYTAMPVHSSQPEVKIRLHATHEQWEGVTNSNTSTPSSYKLEMGEHTGTHVDAFNHMGRSYKEQSIDTMPLDMFYTEAICLDLSNKTFNELIEPLDIKKALDKNTQEIKKGDTVLFYTDHYRKAYGTNNWSNGPGISIETARWLGEHKIAAFGVETMSPGIPKISNKEVHEICGKLGFTHYENLINLYKLINKGRFRFIGFPLKIKGGTGSPVRAVAVFE